MRISVKRTILTALTVIAALLAATPALAQDHPESERDYDESIRRPIRRLHPERERDKAIKAMERQQQEQERRQQRQSTPRTATDDPWATSGDATGQTSTSDKALLNELLSHDYSLVQIVPDAAKPYAWVDEPVDATESDLLQHVDRTAQGAAVRYMPHGATMDNTKNAFFFYFDERTAPEPLRLRVQYYADDPLEFDRIDFEIDGFEYSYRPKRKQSGHVYGRMIWENSDDPLSVPDKDLVYALTHCRWAKISLVGREGISHVKLLSDEQLQGLKAVLQLYMLRGGSI